MAQPSLELEIVSPALDGKLSCSSSRHNARPSPLLPIICFLPLSSSSVVVVLRLLLVLQVVAREPSEEEEEEEGPKSTHLLPPSASITGEEASDECWGCRRDVEGFPCG